MHYSGCREFNREVGAKAGLRNGRQLRRREASEHNKSAGALHHVCKIDRFATLLLRYLLRCGWAVYLTALDCFKRPTSRIAERESGGVERIDLRGDSTRQDSTRPAIPAPTPYDCARWNTKKNTATLKAAKA